MDDDLSQWVFAEVHYPQKYAHIHADLVSLLRSQFSTVDAGLQGDSWVWVLDGGEKVAVDTFTSMKHRVKSRKAGPHVQRVIDALRSTYEVELFDPPLEE